MKWIRTATPLIILSLFSGAIAYGGTNPQLPASASPRIPFAFAANRGQADPRVRYIGAGPEFKAWFEDGGVTLQKGGALVKLTFQGSSGPKELSADSPIGARANYLYGNDPAHWQKDLPLFAAIHYKGLWPGIDLTYKTEQSRLKAEYIVAPGARPDSILLRFDGDPHIERDGTPADPRPRMATSSKISRSFTSRSQASVWKSPGNSGRRPRA